MIWQDLRFGFRSLAKAPVVTALAIVSLGLGIGANTTIFSLLDQVVLRSLPVDEPDRLVQFGDESGGGISISSVPPTRRYSYPFFEAFRDNAESFDLICATDTSDFTAFVRRGSAEGTPARARLVSGEYFPLFDVVPEHGRFFTAEEMSDGEPAVAVISHAYWQEQFGGQRTAVGETLPIHDRIYEIIGIAPAGFSGEHVGRTVDLWLPVTMQGPLRQRDSFIARAQVSWMRLFGRLKPGVSRAQAEAEVNVLFKQFGEQFYGDGMDDEDRELFAEQSVVLTPAGRGVSRLRSAIDEPLRLVMLVVGLVLLIACANVANLLLARASSRVGEMGIRRALGAQRGRLIRQLLTESLILSLAGALLGLGVAAWAGPVLLGMMSDNPASLGLSTSPDQRVLLFTLALAVATGLGFGVAPALRASAVGIQQTLRASSRSLLASESRFGLKKVLVASQIALSLLLVLGAGLLLRTVDNLRGVDLGFDTERVVHFRLSTRGAAADDRLDALYRRMLEEVSATPGVESVGLSLTSVLDNSTRSNTLVVDGYTPAPREDMDFVVEYVSEGYFETLGMRAQQGELFDDRSGSGEPQVIITDAARRRFYPGEPALGRTVRFGLEAEDAYRIVGVVPDIRDDDLRDEPPVMAFFPLFGSSQHIYAMLIRTSVEPATVEPAVRAALERVSPELRVFGVETLAEHVDDAIANERILTRLITSFAGLALLLAAVGLFGVLSYAVGQRTQEIGVRMALGAGVRDILRMVLRDVALLVAIGAAVGVPAAYAAGHAVESMLYGVAPYDLSLTLIALAILAGVGFAAGALPAWRACRVQPNQALRYE